MSTLEKTVIQEHLTEDTVDSQYFKYGELILCRECKETNKRARKILE